MTSQASSSRTISASASATLDEEKEMTNEEFNETLTIESMLQVVDASSGVAADVRQMLAIRDEDIKNETVRASIKKCDFMESVLSL
jgi:hypothetical protein